MDAHIDWLSFTLETEREPVNHYDLYLLARSLIRQVGEQHEHYIFDKSGFEPSLSRTPYRLCLVRGDSGVRLYGDSPTGTVLFELSGRACEGLHQHEDAVAFIAPLHSRLSRIDYAIDIRSDTTPAHFANERSHRSFRTISFIRSDTGETAYIGSAKSDRFCRVYRYNPPHPRANLLRVEFVFRRGLARAFAGELVEAPGSREILAKLGNTYGYAHPDWQPGHQTDERMSVPAVSQKHQDTVWWLYKQVAPAVRRLMADGAFDITEWLQFIYEEKGQS